MNETGTNGGGDAEQLPKYIEMDDVAPVDPAGDDNRRYRMLIKDDQDNVATGYINDRDTDWYACVLWRTDSRPVDGPRTYQVTQWFRRDAAHCGGVDADGDIDDAGAMEWLVEALHRHNDVDNLDGRGVVHLTSWQTGDCTVTIDGVEPVADD
jgi:hypothetical protein